MHRGIRYWGLKISRDVSTIRQWERERDWEPVRVNAPDGKILRGTYIENRRDSHKTVILIHGLYQNRTMCLPYMDEYRRLGYNILLIDLRGHGESEGDHTEWGISEVDDLLVSVAAKPRSADDHRSARYFPWRLDGLIVRRQ